MQQETIETGFDVELCIIMIIQQKAKDLGDEIRVTEGQYCFLVYHCERLVSDIQDNEEKANTIRRYIDENAIFEKINTPH